MFSSVRFSVVGLILRSLTHLDLSFVHGDRHKSIYPSTCWHLVMLAPFVENALFFSLYNSRFFVKNQVFVGMGKDPHQPHIGQRTDLQNI